MKVGLLKYLPVTLVTIIWGISFIATKVVVSSFPPYPAAFYRFVIALLVLLPLSKNKSVLRDLNAFWAGFWGVTMYFVFENMALIYTRPTNAAIIVSSAPILYVIFTHLIRKQQTTLNQYLGSLLAFTGVALVILNGRLMKLNPLGDILAFGSAMAWVFYTHYILKMPKHDGIDEVFAITFWGAVTLIPFSMLQDPMFSSIIKLTPPALIGLLYLGILCSALGYLLWNKSITLIGDRRTTNAIYFIPVVTVLSEKILLRTPLTLYTVTGTVLLIAGLFTFEKGNIKRQK
uniref:DMT family transporter n=1 Tax=Fervidobacterium thailandense TaxID=1008305 RepID=A0A7C4RVQ1_9BACT